MRENRTYGSEGGVAIAIPTPIEKGGKTHIFIHNYFPKEYDWFFISRRSYELGKG